MNRWFVAALAAGGVFASLAVAVWREVPAIRATDTAIHSWAVTTRSETSIEFARVVTEMGSTFVVMPIILVLGFLSLPRRPFRVRILAGLLLMGVAGLGMLVGLTVNAAVNGLRPGQENWLGAAGGPTFPSGHTTVGTVLAASIAWAAYTRLGRSEVPALVLAVAVAAGVGWSRLWLGVHWPSDVVGGWVFGTAWAAAAIGVLSEMRRRYPDRLSRLIPADSSRPQPADRQGRTPTRQ
jgi:membrane-associated phospholipid phosphatase